MKIYLSKRSKYGFDLFFVIKYLQFLFEKKIFDSVHARNIKNCTVNKSPNTSD